MYVVIVPPRLMALVGIVIDPINMSMNVMQIMNNFSIYYLKMNNMSKLQIPESLLDKLLYRQKLAESGVLFKTPHRCSNCNNEFDCGSWECDESEKVFCSIECSKEYDD